MLQPIRCCISATHAAFTGRSFYYVQVHQLWLGKEGSIAHLTQALAELSIPVREGIIAHGLHEVRQVLHLFHIEPPSAASTNMAFPA